MANLNQTRVELETPRMVENVVRFTTNLKVGDYVTDVAKFEVQEMRRVTRYQQNAPIPEIQEVEDYLVTLLHIRVLIGNKQPLGEYGKRLNSLRVPARWYVLLAQVGEAMDTTRRFKFYPELDLTVVDEKGNTSERALLPIDKMLDFSDKLDVLLEDGYVTVPGVPRDSEGSLQFMSKTTIGNIIRGMDKDNPAYGFLAFILESEVAAESYDNLDLVFRINYSSYDTYSAAFKSYFVTSTDELGGNANGQSEAQ